ncbi:hypothetical protein UPYG_G00122310 [Umbra pygmaea]|uniref:ARID domain-containing protein n=1 Tax=Umbra pygmaea TaxID=75934 RepID=A0ABD0X593_UMBPY
MEQNAIQWLGAPSCLRGSFAFYKSVSCGAAQVWKLGEFYYVRCGPQEPVCIAEVTLLWEDQVQRHLLASSRLYFLPEDTPKGRTREHGEDEVVAVSKKIVVTVEDLVRWTCPEPPGWKAGSQKTSQNKSHTRIFTNGVPTPLKEKAESQNLGVKVLSYLQYCRFRSLQKRTQDRVGLELQDPHVFALGGIRLGQHNTRVLYCRDTFHHPTLNNNSCVWTQLECTSLSLKGRPRKRRSRPESMNAVETPDLKQPVSWIERMKENVMGSVETHCEGDWLQHPEEQLFLDRLHSYMEDRGSPISKVPNLGFKKIDLFVMYSVVKRLGGYNRVTSQRLWKKVYNELGGCPGSTSAATCTRRHYERLMLPYEEHINGGGADVKVPGSSVPAQSMGESKRRTLVKGRGPEVNQKGKKTVSPPPPSDVSSDGLVVVKRGRGRPPGRKNQGKLQATKAIPTAPPPPGKPTVDLRTQQDPSVQSPCVFQGNSLANLPLTPDLSPMSAPFLHLLPQMQRDLKVPNDDTPAPSPTVSPATLLSALPRLHTGGSLGGFSPTKGLCPLDVFKSRLGLPIQDRPGLTPQDSLQPSSLQAKAESQDSALSNGDHPLSHHQCPGCGLDDSTQRPPLPPLRVLPLDLNCSLHVRQLMRTRLCSAQILSFTKQLSEVLAQDLSRKPCLPVTPSPEQALPLNLSKRSATRRPSSDADFRVSAGDHPRLTIAKRPKVESCDEPEDLSSPSRARAFILELHPDPSTCIRQEEDLRKSYLVDVEPADDMSVKSERGILENMEREGETIKMEESVSEKVEVGTKIGDILTERPRDSVAQSTRGSDCLLLPVDNEMDCDIETRKGPSSPVLAQTQAQPSSLNTSTQTQLHACTQHTR